MSVNLTRNGEGLLGLEAQAGEGGPHSPLSGSGGSDGGNGKRFSLVVQSDEE